MGLYVYCPRPSNGALELVKALGCPRIRRFDGQDFWDKRARFKLREGDVVLAWGTTLPEIDGVRILNAAAAPINKFKELGILRGAGVPCVTPYAQAPANAINSILPRVTKHSGGKDLLVTPKMPDYYVLKENFSEEYRIHSFAGASIRAGIKVHREGFTLVDEINWKANSGLVHPWIRSFDAGWRVNYDGFKSNAKMRKIAHLAVESLGLTFGAVDIGLVFGSTAYKVLEVNQAPGIEGNSIQSYVRAIQKWVEGKPGREPEL